MKKIFSLFLFVLFLTMNYSLLCEGNVSKADDCDGREPGDGYYKCCYFHFRSTNQESSTEIKQCKPFTENELENFDDFIDNFEEEMENEGKTVELITIDCEPKSPFGFNSCEREATKYSDCENREPGDDYYKCCYLELDYDYKGENIYAKECLPLKRKQYYNISDYIQNTKDDIEKEGGNVKNINIDCGPKENIDICIDNCDIDSDDPCSMVASKASDCKDREVGDENYSCCFIDFQFEYQGTTKELKQCVPATLYDYNNLDEYIIDFKEEFGPLGYKVIKYDMDCFKESNGYSNNINIFILSLMMLSFF